MSSKASLPKKKDWKPGTFQIGLFMRTDKGMVINLTANRATPAMCARFSQMVEAVGGPTVSKDRTFDEWLKIWIDRFDKREVKRLANSRTAVTPTTT